MNQHSQNSIKPVNLGFLWLVFVINFPLLSELIRRFFYYSDILFVAGDVLILGTFLFTAKKCLKAASLGVTFSISAGLLLAWGALTTLNHGNPMIAFIGVRAIFLPFLYLLISARLCRDHTNGWKAIFSSASAWCILISLVALVQILLGRGHSINELPLEISSSGIGDFSVESEGLALEYLFRPTSIFLHTGKFGQIIFVLVLFKWAHLYLNPLARTAPMLLSIPIDICGVIISGQRSAYLFLSIAIAALILAGSRTTKALLGRLTTGLALVAPLYFLKDINQNEFLNIVFMRYSSGFADTFSRFNENLLQPSAEIIDAYALIGEGLGYFTLGAARFGGKILYEHGVVTSGIAENSWLRLTAEMGLFGAILFFLMLASLIYRVAQTTIPPSHIASQPSRASRFFLCTWLLCLCAWAVTHDVFSNSVLMSVGFGLSGAALLSLKKADHPD